MNNDWILTHEQKPGYSQFPDSMKAPSTSITNQLARDASAVVEVPEGDVPTCSLRRGHHSPESSSPGGKNFPEKAVAFWQRKAALRKQPHRCSRCAKPHAGGGQCQVCKDYAAAYRARKRVDGLPPVAPQAVAALEKRVASLEHYFAQLSNAQRIGYNRGYIAGRRLHRAAAERASYHDALPHGISRRELAEISHEHRR